MKRSEINAIIKDFESKLREFKFALPPFLSFTPEEWAEKGHEYDEIRDNALGWDVTDYGEGRFDTLGLSLITIRNGNVHNSKYTKTYAEKIMMLREGQVSPNHFHWNKMEDIINRGGGRIIFKLWNATPDEELADTDVEICRDGRRYMVPAGSGEVSMCNDDNSDNRFYQPLGRFPTIEEDEPPYRLLCNEYPPAKD